MDFILQASNQSSLEFVFSPSGNNGEYLLSSDDQHRSSSTLEFKGVGLLTFCASKLSVSIFSEHQVFVYKEKCGNLLISSSLELLLSCKKSRTTPNINYFIEYIACGATPRVHTPFLDVFYLPPGSVLSSSDMHVDLGEELDPREIELLETLEDGLRKRLAGVRTVMLEYSGGLESSILLHSLLEVMPDGDLQLIHLTDFASGQVDDLQRVKSLAAKHRCDLTILDVEDLKPFQVTTCSNIKPNFPHPGLVNIGYLDYSSHLLSSQSTAIFNGAGGDSIFCAAPQKGLPVELLKKGDVIGAFKSSLCISNYLRSPFIHAIKESFEEYRGMQMKLDDPGRFFANSNGINKVVASGHCAGEFKVDIPAHPHCREVSTLERHLNSAVNRYEMQSSPMAAFAGRYICPFLAPDILSTGLATPSDQLLKYGIDRYSIRKRAADKYQSDEFWYRRKGGVAGLTQRCFLHYKSEIKSFITEGYLVRADIVNVDGMCRLIDEVAAGVVKCPGSLINLFTANIYINHWKGYVDEFEQQKEGFVQWGKGVTAAIYNGKITALNEASNEFIFFDDIQSSLLFSILGAPSSKLSEDEVGSLNDLVSQGLIRLGEKLPKEFFQDEKISKGAFECDWALGKSRVDLSDFRPKYFIRAMIFLSSAKKNSDKGKLHIILQDLRRFPPDSMAADEAELHKIASNVNLAVFCLWRKVKCLEFAYAVARIAFSHNVKCKFIVGVQTHPFISHAWVEGESGVVYDRKELPMELAKIVSIGGSGNA